MVEVTLEKHLARVGWVSTVGIGNSGYPLTFGNYFWLDDGLRIINMWAENLEHIVSTRNLNEVRCRVFTDSKGNKLGLVEDECIPRGYYTRLCVTGCGWGSRELCETILDYKNLPITNEVCGCEKFDESPRISHKWAGGQPNEYRCHRCNRSWNEV